MYIIIDLQFQLKTTISIFCLIFIFKLQNSEMFKGVVTSIVLSSRLDFSLKSFQLKLLKFYLTFVYTVYFKNV